MGRLIDADDLINLLGFENSQEERENNADEIITLEDIDKLPTAYDVDNVDNVVKQLKKDGLSFDDEYHYLAVQRVIEIVKAGGIK